MSEKVMSEAESRIREVCFNQNCESFRSLNQQMNQIPVLATTLTGGLWFGAGVTESLDMKLRFILLLFAGACNLALALAMVRVRDVLESYFEKIEEFHPASFADGQPTKNKPKLAWLGSYSMVGIYCTLMLLGAFASFVGAFFIYWPFEFCPWFGVAILALTLGALYFILFNRTSVRRHGRV
jgi:hypothetical protein